MKRIATIMLVVVIVGSSAFAEAKWGGIARQISMGGSAAGTGLVLNPFITQDPAWLLVNPAYQAMYKDYAWMNIGGGTLNNLTTGDNGYGSQNAGLAFSLNKEWSLGLIGSYDPSGVNQVASLIAGGTIGNLNVPTILPAGRAAQAIPRVANVFEIVTAYRMASFDIGFALMYGWSNSDGKSNITTPAAASSEREASSRVLGLRFGGVYDLGSGSSVDFSAAFRMDKATDNIKNNPVVNGAGGEYSASGTEFVFQARGKLKVNNKVNFVPYGTIGLLSAEPKEDSPPAGGTATKATEKFSGTAYAIGAGAEYKTRDFYLAGGLSYQFAKQKVESTPNPPAGAQATTTTTSWSYSALPVFNIGAEWWFTDWLAGRGGYYRSLGSTNVKTEATNGSNEVNLTAPNSALLIGGFVGADQALIMLGLGMKFGNFSLDATVSEEALRRGLGLLGPNDNLNTFGYMTMSYNFE